MVKSGKEFPMNIIKKSVVSSAATAIAVMVGTLIGACADPVQAVEGAASPVYTTLFSDDFERADSDTLGADWSEIEFQGSPPNEVYLQSGKAVLLGGRYTAGSSQTIVPQAYYFCNLTQPHARVTVDLDQPLSTVIDLTIHVCFDHLVGSAVVGDQYSFQIYEDYGGNRESFMLGIVGPEAAVYQSNAFPLAPTDALSVIMEKDGTRLRLTLRNNATGVSFSVTAAAIPEFTSSQSVILTGGRFSGVRLATAVEAFRLETAE